MYCFDPHLLPAKRPVDLVLIDGPPAILGGREGILYQAMDFCRVGSVLLLDDANRKQEKEILKNWEQAFGDAIEIQNFPHFEKGLAAIIIHQQIRLADFEGYRTRAITDELRLLTGANTRVIVVDDSQTLVRSLSKICQTLPFLERDGQFWGPPGTDEEALRELDRMRASGESFIVFANHARWWLDYYADFARHLRANFPCIVENDRLVVFALQEQL